MNNSFVKVFQNKLREMLSLLTEGVWGWDPVNKKAVIKYRQKNSVVVLLQRREEGYYITVNLS